MLLRQRAVIVRPVVWYRYRISCRSRRSNGHRRRRGDNGSRSRSRSRFLSPIGPMVFIGLMTWFLGSPKTQNGVATYLCRPVTCSPPARYSRRSCLAFGEALSGESPNMQRTHHSMKGRAIPVLSMVRRVQKVGEPFPHYPLIAGSLNDHHLVRERARREFRAVRHTWPERRWFAVQIRPGVSPDSSRSQPRLPEYRSPPAPRIGRKRPEAARRAGAASPA